MCICLQESELIDRVDEEGKEDSAHSPVPEDKPKIQVSQLFFCTFTVDVRKHVHTLNFCLLTVARLSSAFLLSPGCHPPAAVGSVPLHDGPDTGPDSGHRDSQTLCLQPAGGGPHPGATELALPKGHV